MQGTDNQKIAIVGMGPRGLGALEALAATFAGSPRPPAVDIFDPFTSPGAGPNFDPKESEVCRLNIPLRDLDIRPRNACVIGGFADWLGESARDVDDFPNREELGRYLEARYADLADQSELPLTRRLTRVDEITRRDDGWLLKAGDTVKGPYSEVLLALGQPEARPDDQMARWQEHERRSNGILADAYPAWKLVESAKDWPDRTVAIRGLALSAFDVVRSLTLAQGGRFENGRYTPSGREPARIIPFSLDGRPPFPKPRTQEIDANFEPTAEEKVNFLRQMRAASQATPDLAQHLINQALQPVVKRLQRVNGGDREGISRWLETEWISPGTQDTGSAVDALRDGLAMADGSSAPSIGYTVGQSWRKLQDELRKGFNPVPKHPETVKKLIDFDEGLKRYSYGPPVDSCRELLELVEACIVDLGYSADPEITLVDDGWRLSANGRDVTADVMIDAVLPSPDLSTIDDPLVVALVKDGVLCDITEGLGVRTVPDGTVIGKDGRSWPGLSSLGRLALGSVIAVDSLHDCFGEATQRWATGVATRFEATD